MKELYTELEENNKDNWADADLHYATEQMKEDDAKEKREPSCLNKTKTEEEEDKVKEVTAEIGNFLLWYYHKNYDESTGELRNLYDAIDHYVDEVMDLESELE